MKIMKNIAICIIAVVLILIASFGIINSTIFNPSLGSRLFRMMMKSSFEKIRQSKDLVRAMRELEKSTFILPLPWGATVEKVIINGLNAEWVRGEGVPAQSKKVVLYFHGGGFIIGSCASHRDLAVRISKSAGVPLLVVEYRLAPEHKFPAANDDCLGAYRWLLKKGYNPDNIAMGGDSAGGSLTLMTLLTLRDKKEPLPAAAFLLSPNTDIIHPDGETYHTRAALDPMIDKDNYFRAITPFIGHLKNMPAILSPVMQDLSGLPPMLIQVGNDEVLLSDSTRLAERAKKAGVEVTIQVWEHMCHVFQLGAAFVPEARQAIDVIGIFLRKNLNVSIQ